MDLRRKDTPENRAFREMRDLFLALIYLATERGIKAIDMSRKDIARAFFTAFISVVEYAWILRNGASYFLKDPFIDWVGTNKRLSHILTGTELQRNHQELCNDLYHLLTFRRRDYTGGPESEVWYESRFEEWLQDLNKTRSFAFAMSVRDVRTAEEVLSRLSDKEKQVLTEIISGINSVSCYLKLV